MDRTGYISKTVSNKVEYKLKQLLKKSGKEYELTIKKEK